MGVRTAEMLRELGSTEAFYKKMETAPDRQLAELQVTLFDKYPFLSDDPHAAASTAPHASVWGGAQAAAAAEAHTSIYVEAAAPENAAGIRLYDTASQGLSAASESSFRIVYHVVSYKYARRV